MATPWYYDYHEKGAFPHQQKLCEAVAWTKCNLEGSKLKSQTVLSAVNANPLTIRLLALDEALEHFDNAKTIDNKIKELVREQLDKNKVSGMGGTWHAQNSPLNTGGAPIEIIEIAGERLELRHIDIHLALYEFFTNFGSVIDRLAYEINLLYGLGVKMVDWSEVTDVRQGKGKNWKALNSKDANLSGFIRNCTSQFTKALGYRNRLTHDGIIRIEVDVHSFSGVSIMLAEDCQNDTSPMNVDAVSFCERTKAGVLKLLDGSYELMFQHLQSYGKPPW